MAIQGTGDNEFTFPVNFQLIFFQLRKNRCHSGSEFDEGKRTVSCAERESSHFNGIFSELAVKKSLNVDGYCHDNNNG